MTTNLVEVEYIFIFESEIQITFLTQDNLWGERVKRKVLVGIWVVLTDQNGCQTKETCSQFRMIWHINFVYVIVWKTTKK